MKLLRTILFLAPLLLVSGIATSLVAQVHVMPGGVHAQITAHGILVSWSASTSPNVQYNVWRATTTGGPYGPNPVNPALLSGLSFEDTTGTPATVYFYVVRSVDSFGTASVNSNEASATFPKPPAPAPPTGLSAVSN